jgi:hypothetical protein
MQRLVIGGGVTIVLSLIVASETVQTADIVKKQRVICRINDADKQ